MLLHVQNKFGKNLVNCDNSPNLPKFFTVWYLLGSIIATAWLTILKHAKVYACGLANQCQKNYMLEQSRACVFMMHIAMEDTSSVYTCAHHGSLNYRTSSIFHACAYKLYIKIFEKVSSHVDRISMFGLEPCHKYTSLHD